MISLEEIGGLYQSIPANLKDPRTKSLAYAVTGRLNGCWNVQQKSKYGVMLEV